MFRKLLLFLVLSTVVLTGCEYINPIGPMIQLGVMWHNGEASKYYNTDHRTIHKAVKVVLKDLNFPITSEDDDGNGYIYIVADADQRFKIKIIEVRQNVTKLSIRVGTFGDHAYAEMIYRHVDAEEGVKDFVTLDELNTALERQPRFR